MDNIINEHTTSFIPIDDLINIFNCREILVRKMILMDSSRPTLNISKLTLKEEIINRKDFRYLLPFISKMITKYECTNGMIERKKMERTMFNSIIELVRKNISKKVRFYDHPNKNEYVADDDFVCGVWDEFSKILYGARDDDGNITYECMDGLRTDIRLFFINNTRDIN
jgi:hypothetical protein